MSARPNVLVFADRQDTGDALANRLRSVGLRPVQAKTAEEALELVGSKRFGIAAAVLTPDLPVVDLGSALTAMRARAVCDDLQFVLVGAQPDAGGVARLAEAGIELVVWLPAPDAALRFQVNRALDGQAGRKGRENTRVPVARRVRVVSGRFAKAATLYTLSTGGAFVETPRPSPRGARVLLELVLPACDAVVEGRVIYTNVPGNLQRENLPVGMGVEFCDLGNDVRQAIEACTTEAARAIQLEADASAEPGWLRRLLTRRG